MARKYPKHIVEGLLSHPTVPRGNMSVSDCVTALNMNKSLLAGNPAILADALPALPRGFKPVPDYPTVYVYWPTGAVFTSHLVKATARKSARAMQWRVELKDSMGKWRTVDRDAIIAAARDAEGNADTLERRKVKTYWTIPGFPGYVVHTPSQRIYGLTPLKTGGKQGGRVRHVVTNVYGLRRKEYRYRLVVAAREGHWNFGTVDHIDADPTNDKPTNLRPATAREQAFTRDAHTLARRVARHAAAVQRSNATTAERAD